MLQLNGQEINGADTPLFLSLGGKTGSIERSMYARFSEETGLSKASANTLRKTAPTNLLSDAEQRAYEPAVMDHDKSVAAEYYDTGALAQKVKT